MAYTITPQEIEEYKKYLEEHPVDHSWDEKFGYLDAKIPAEELTSRAIYSLLKDLGEIE